MLWKVLLFPPSLYTPIKVQETYPTGIINLICLKSTLENERQMQYITDPLVYFDFSSQLEKSDLSL